MKNMHIFFLKKQSFQQISFDVDFNDIEFLTYFQCYKVHFKSH